MIKYEFSPIAAIVQVKEKNWVIFLTRMLGVVGGIISTSGLNFRAFLKFLFSGNFCFPLNSGPQNMHDEINANFSCES